MLAVPGDQLPMGNGTEEEVKLSLLKTKHLIGTKLGKEVGIQKNGSIFDNSTQISNVSRPKTTSI